MPDIRIDEKTAKSLQDLAKARGMTVPQYLQSLVKQSHSKDRTHLSLAEIQILKKVLSVDDPS